MALARNQITLIDVNDGYVGGDGKSYVLNILGGQRSIIYDQDGTGYSPAPTSFTAELIVDGVVTPPTNYAWSAQGHLSGTGNGASFTPSYAASFNNSLSVGDAIFLTVTYNGMTIRNVAPIAVSKVGTNGIPTYTWVRYADDISGNGISDLPAGKHYIGFAHNKLTPTESNLPGDYTWSLIKGEVGPQGPQGATGSQGPKGDTGTSVENVTEYYLATGSASGVTTDTAGWTTTIQTMTPTNKYLWNYEVIHFSDGSTQPTIPVIIGAYGNTGSTGATGRSLTGVTEHYLATSVATGITRATSGWTTTMQTTTPTNKYLWNYETLTWSSAPITTYVEPIIIGIHGEQGIQGATGSQGPKGDTGTSVNGVIEYYLATSAATGVTTSTSGWSTTMQPMTTTNKYLWNYEVISFSDGSSSPTIPVIIGVYGNTGDTGATGRSLTAVTEYYLASASSSGVTRTTSGWTTTMQTTTPSLPYLWNYEKLDWSSAPLVTYIEPIVIGIHGPQGPQGPQGATGAQGKGILSTVITYQASTSGTTAPTGVWSGTIPSVAENQYLWTRTVITYTDDQTTTAYSVGKMGAKGETGSTGATGSQGPAGKGISNTTVTYQASASGTTTPTGTWSATVPAVSADQYLWTRIIITYTDTTYTTSYAIGKMGAQGPQGAKGDTGATGATGAQGPKGDTGTSVSGVTEYYLATSAASGVTAATSGWTTSMQTMTTTNKYLWNYEVISFSDGSTSPTIPVIIGVHGNTGSTGATGATGRSLTAVTEYYLASASASGVTRATAGWTTTMQTTTSALPYLWNYEQLTWSSGTTTTYVEPIIIGIHGAQGPQGPQGAKGDTGATGPGGAPAKLVKINASATIFKSGDGGATFNPATIVLTPTLQGGVTYSNWQYSTNGGSTWTAVTSGQNGLTISSGVLTIAKTSALFTILITSVVFKVNTNDAAVSDTITISKLYDVVDLGQQAIFDRLTGGGANEGLFLSGGKVYINGTYIRTGNLVAGNAMIQNGYLNTAVIQDGTIVTAKIGDAQITNAKIANLAVTTAKIGDAQITNAKIANLAVDSAKIADAAITTAKIGNAQITNALIANATIEAAKIKSINASTITTGTLSADRIQGGTLTMGGSSNGNGLILIKDLLNRQVMKLDKDGLIMDMFYNAVGEPTNQFLIRDGATQTELLKIGASGELIYNGVATFNELFLDSTLYLWADLNAWGNTIVNGSGNLGVQDTRSSNMSTNLGEKGVRFDFKSNAAQGLNDGGTYHSAMTIQPWSDSSGGNIAQLAFTSNGNMWLRSTPIGGTWPGWKRVALSDDSIVASGSNANGRYLRFGDGTLICWAERTFSTTVALAWGSLFYHDVQSWTFPHAFAGAKPVCSATYIDSGAELIGMVPNSTLTNITFYGMRPTSVPASTAFNVRLMAIGRWR